MSLSGILKTILFVFDSQGMPMGGMVNQHIPLAHVAGATEEVGGACNIHHSRWD